MSNEEKSTKRRRPRGSSRKRGGSRRRREETNVAASWSPADFDVPEAEGKRRFHDFNLPDAVLRAIQDLGFQYCTPIQAATIEPALAGKDIIGKAQTGTGKTAAFLAGIITDLLDYPLADERKLGEPRALIVAPTRELALQIAADAEGLSKYANFGVVALVGGMDYDKQRAQLRERPVDILVATPGRLIDFVRSKEVDLYNVEVLVLDEADRMLSMGFIPDVRTIIRQTPRKGEDRQTLLYSATFSDDIMNLAKQWTVDPIKVEIESEHKTTDNVSQTVFLVSSNQKYRLLRNYIRVNGIEKVIVFGNRRHETRALAERLQKDGLKAALMSGEIPQNKRLRTLEDFRSGKIQVLVATDVAGRGIHIDGVTHVINYQLPEEPDDYVHRIGRTGRAGASGESVCFACENDSFLIPEIEAETGVKLECVHPDAELLKEVPEIRVEKAPVEPPEAEVAGQSEDNGEVADVQTQDAPVETEASVSPDVSERPVAEGGLQQDLEDQQQGAEQATASAAEAESPPASGEPEVASAGASESAVKADADASDKPAEQDAAEGEAAATADKSVVTEEAVEPASETALDAGEAEANKSGASTRRDVQ
ncbi:MAG: ATP-dependent RNA helicase RhlB [Oceanospirillaceae bacterium]|nr:ATP-dependent RNA helicase RhlB [Oceanospirillaceae bacterium]